VKFNAHTRNTLLNVLNLDVLVDIFVIELYVTVEIM